MMGGPCYSPLPEYPKPRKPVRAVPAAALLPWVRLSDAALVASLGPLADQLEEAGDDRADVVRKGSVSFDSESSPFVWCANLGNGPRGCSRSQTRAVAELARRVRELLGYVACPTCGGKGAWHGVGCVWCENTGYVAVDVRVTPRPCDCGGGGFVGVDAEAQK